MRAGPAPRGCRFRHAVFRHGRYTRCGGLTWFAPLPVLLISSRLGQWSAFLAGALCWSLGSLNMWHYMLTNFAGLPLVL